MRRRPRGPDPPQPPPGPPEAIGSWDEALVALTHVTSALVRLAGEDRPITDAQLDALRLRRHQLSAVISSLTRWRR